MYTKKVKRYTSIAPLKIKYVNTIRSDPFRTLIFLNVFENFSFT